MNVEWALGELDGFISATETRYVPSPPGTIGFGYSTTAESEEGVIKRAQVVELILDRALPDWRIGLPTPRNELWSDHREAAIRARESLTREKEIRENLGDNAPKLSASDFHSWIWDGAASLWLSGHFREAVEGAIRKLNAETQNKVGRRDVAETVLFQQAFSPHPAQAGKPRLHRIPREDNDTYRSLQRGAMAFAEGIFAGIRNPLAHEAEHDLTEQQALEYLAALSVLARWVDDAAVETVEGIP
ncbi:MAG: TIGR02391 family protein [Thermomicrobiales bacterium]